MSASASHKGKFESTGGPVQIPIAQRDRSHMSRKPPCRTCTLSGLLADHPPFESNPLGRIRLSRWPDSERMAGRSEVEHGQRRPTQDDKPACMLEGGWVFESNEKRWLVCIAAEGQAESCASLFHPQGSKVSHTLTPALLSHGYRVVKIHGARRLRLSGRRPSVCGRAVPTPDSRFFRCDRRASRIRADGFTVARRAATSVPGFPVWTLFQTILHSG